MVWVGAYGTKPLAERSLSSWQSVRYDDVKPVLDDLLVVLPLLGAAFAN